MKKDLNKFWVAPVKQAPNNSHKEIFDLYIDTFTTYNLKIVDYRIFYEKEENGLIFFIDIETKQKYNSYFIFAQLDDFIIDRREIFPLSNILNKLNIDLPKNNKISEKKLIKTLKQNYKNTQK